MGGWSPRRSLPCRRRESRAEEHTGRLTATAATMLDRSEVLSGGRMRDGKGGHGETNAAAHWAGLSPSGALDLSTQATPPAATAGCCRSCPSCCVADARSRAGSAADRVRPHWRQTLSSPPRNRSTYRSPRQRGHALNSIMDSFLCFVVGTPANGCHPAHLSRLSGGDSATCSVLSWPSSTPEQRQPCPEYALNYREQPTARQGTGSGAMRLAATGLCLVVGLCSGT